MTLTFRWTESDWIAARFTWLLHHRRKVVAVLLTYAEAIFWIGGFFVIAVITLVERPSDWQTLNPFLWALIFMVPGAATARWRTNKQFRRKFGKDLSAVATIDEGGVTLSSGGCTKAQLWVGFTKIYESGRVIVMEIGGKDFIFLPKRAMSGAQLQEFKRLATAGALDCPVRIVSA